jgi:hypothetical protein
MINECTAFGGMTIGRGNPSTLKRNRPSATLSTIFPTWSDLASNPARRGVKQAINSLDQGPSFMRKYVHWLFSYFFLIFFLLFLIILLLYLLLVFFSFTSSSSSYSPPPPLYSYYFHAFFPFPLFFFLLFFSYSTASSTFSFFSITLPVSFQSYTNVPKYCN